MVGKVPSGGYTTMLALECVTGELRAASELGDHPGEKRVRGLHPDVISCNLHFFSPSVVGEFTCDVEILKAGRSTSVVQARMFQLVKGKVRETIRAMATCGDLRAAEARGPNYKDKSRGSAAPELPLFEQCLRLDAGDNKPPSVRSQVHLLVPKLTADHYAATRETRTDGTFSENILVTRHKAVKSRPTASYEGYCVYASDPDSTPRLADAPMFLDANVPAVLGALVSGWVPTIDWRVDFKGHPSDNSGPLRFRFKSRRVTGGFLEEDGELWDSNGNLIALSRQLGLVGVSQAKM